MSSDLLGDIADAIEVIESSERRNKGARNEKVHRTKLESVRYRGFPRLARYDVRSLDAESDTRDLLRR